MTNLPKKRVNFYQNALFTFNSYKCYCAIDTINTSPTEIKNVIKVTSIKAEPIKFAFQPIDGLVRVSINNGAIEEENILSTLLSISKGKIDNYKKFFERNGFFLPLKDNEFEEINDDSLIYLIERMRTTVELMSQISEIQHKDYKKMLTLTLFLLLETPKEIKVGNKSIKTCYHKTLMGEIEKAYDVDDSNINYKKLDEDYNFEVEDTIYGKCKINIDEYNRLTSDTELLDDFWRAVLRSYVNRTNINKKSRLIIEFLYHVFFNIGWFWSISKDGIDFACQEEKIKWNNFDSKLKEALETVAKITIAEEINSNITGVHPEYDSNIMEPRWRVDSLLSALYFSIFYMKPNIELTRICANPKCNKYFTVSRTSLKKKYCCTECANRAIQSRYRAKKKGSLE